MALFASHFGGKAVALHLYLLKTSTSSFLETGLHHDGCGANSDQRGGGGERLSPYLIPCLAGCDVSRKGRARFSCPIGWQIKKRRNRKRKNTLFRQTPPSIIFLESRKSPQSTSIEKEGIIPVSLLLLPSFSCSLTLA